MLVQVTAQHFCAGIVLRDGVCVQAAPILGWAVGRSERWLADYFRRKRWRVAIISRL